MRLPSATTGNANVPHFGRAGSRGGGNPPGRPFLRDRTDTDTEPTRNLVVLGDFNIFSASDATMKAMTEDGGSTVPPVGIARKYCPNGGQAWAEQARAGPGEIGEDERG
jgi:hypothetical protein